MSKNYDLLILGYDYLVEDHTLLMEAAERVGLLCEVVNPDRLSLEVKSGSVVALLDGYPVSTKSVIPRGVNKVYPFLRTWLESVEHTGVRVFNSTKSTELCLDKLRTAVALSLFDTPMLPTFGTLRPRLLPGYDLFVIKPAFGSGGRGVEVYDPTRVCEYKVDSDFVNHDLIGHFVSQPLAEQAGLDYRVFVINGQAVACTQRKAPIGEFVTNGKLSDVSISDDIDIIKLGIKATNNLGLSYAGVDIIVDHGQPVVLEVNCWPGIGFTSKVTGVDIAGLLSKYIADEIYK